MTTQTELMQWELDGEIKTPGKLVARYGISQACADGLGRYVVHRYETGSFLGAVLANNLKQAVIFADDQNVHLLPQYVEIMRFDLPPACHGSPERVKAWLEQES